MKIPSVSIDPVTDQRFKLLQPLGQGASGAVFLAVDRETGEQVALKKLFNLDQHSVLRFKREFRSLADIHHPNLVKLYELHRGRDAWFITMEFISGKDFGETFGMGGATDRLLPAFYDLACGVHAIHRAGMLHRDLKPSNALVSDKGRVVVLDFGLVRDIDGSNTLTHDRMVAGTPAYMPPEQAVGDQVSEASDWYAFGVMLYEAISGRLPIEGANMMELMHRKLSEDPEPLRTGGPSEVLDLCMQLLSRDPARRPTGANVLDMLAAFSGRQREFTTHQELPLTICSVDSASASTLFGRDDELSRLRAACDDTNASDSLVVHVRGASGSGKSALVETFLEEVPSVSLPAPLVLRSRCYEREAMPFKALDGVMDALVSYLSQLEKLTCARLLPLDIAYLARLFPVLERLDVVQQLLKTRRKRLNDHDTQTRLRAEQALRLLITNVADHQRLIVWIDDMHWCLASHLEPRHG